MKNIGVDIVENERFNSFISNPDKIKRILSIKERDFYNVITNKSRKLEYLAGRFAAKEAIIKALSGTQYIFSYQTISILNNKDGSPYVEFADTNQFKILLSLSHSDHNTVAIAVLL